MKFYPKSQANCFLFLFIYLFLFLTIVYKQALIDMISTLYYTVMKPEFCYLGFVPLFMGGYYEILSKIVG